MSGRRARIEWNAAFEIYLRQLDSKKPVIWGGDLNVCPTSKGKKAENFLPSNFFFLPSFSFRTFG